MTRFKNITFDVQVEEENAAEHLNISVDALKKLAESGKIKVEINRYTKIRYYRISKVLKLKKEMEIINTQALNL